MTLVCAFFLYRNYLPRCRHDGVTQGWGSKSACDKITGQWNQGFSKRMIVHDAAWKLGWRRTEITAGWGNWGILTQHSHFYKFMWKRTLCLSVQQLRLGAFTAVGLDLTQLGEQRSHKMPMLSHFSGIQLFETGWTIPYQAPLSMRFPRQEYWSGLWFPTHKMHSYPTPPPKKRERVLWKKRKCGPLLVSKSLCKELRNSHSILTSKKLGRLLKTKKTRQLFLDI